MHALANTAVSNIHKSTHCCYLVRTLALFLSMLQLSSMLTSVGMPSGAYAFHASAAAMALHRPAFRMLAFRFLSTHCITCSKSRLAVHAFPRSFHICIVFSEHSSVFPSHGAWVLSGGHKMFLPMLEAAWASLLSAVSIQSFSGLSQSCIAEVLLQPLAAALRHKSTAVHDAAEEFWSSSGIQSALKGYDLGLVEAALALVGSQRSQAGNVGIALQQQVRPAIALISFGSAVSCIAMHHTSKQVTMRMYKAEPTIPSITTSWADSHVIASCTACVPFTCLVSLLVLKCRCGLSSLLAGAGLILCSPLYNKGLWPRLPLLLQCQLLMLL